MKLLVMLRAAIHTFLMTRATCDNRIVEMRVTQATPTRSKVEKKEVGGSRKLFFCCGRAHSVKRVAASRTPTADRRRTNNNHYYSD